MEGVFCLKSWFLNALGLVHGGAYYRNFTVFLYGGLIFRFLGTILATWYKYILY